MEGLEFKKIHNVIIDFLKEGNNEELEVIGFWYSRFLKSDIEKLSLHLPYYDKAFTQLTFRYIRSFTIVFNLLKEVRLTEFENTCLFDIFNGSTNNNIDQLTLDFHKQKENIVLWGEDTFTSLDTFLPVFQKERIIHFNNPKTIRNTFELFKSIRDSKIIDFPLFIKLDEKILSFINLDNIKNEFISEKQIFVESILDDDSAMEIEDELIAKKFKNSFLIKYPYSKKPHPYLIDVAKKKFNLVFNNRFAHNDILENEIFLLKDETKLGSKLEYNIIDTNHGEDLYDLFKSFKEEWNLLELNKFTTPFPKYWLLFLNSSLTKEEWLEQFKKDFPAVAEKPIINTLEKIIEAVIELNWIEKVISDSTKILFPKLNSNRKKRLESVFNSFKNYVSSLNSNVEFIDSSDFDNDESVIVLDSFNIIDLVNKNQSCTNGKINVVVPDFLYFGYQPWIKFHLFNYQFTPLLSEMREVLDDNYSTNKGGLEKIKTEIILGIKTDLKIYKSKYKEEIEEEIEEESTNLEDLEYTNTEEIENSDLDFENEIHSVIINENSENELKVASTEKVLLQKDSLFYVKAETLKAGDLIIRNSDISDLYKSDKLYDKLVNIPHNVLSYQNLLHNKSKVYQTLKIKGISYKHQNYFNSNYLLDIDQEQKFRIPRRKKDWAIICEYLNINHSDQQLSFIAYYGRSMQNDLKRMYKSIIGLLLENNWIGTIEDPVIINSVSKIVNQYNSIFNAKDTTEIIDISESIISTILSQLTFTEIQTIKIIKNE